MFKTRFRPKLTPLISRRSGFATRSEFDIPKGFDIKLKTYRAPFFSWKLTLGFGAFGAYLAYSEVLFDKYAQYTKVDESPLLPIQLEFKLKTLPIYQQLTKTDRGKDWVMMKSYENLDRNVLESGNNDGVLIKSDHAVKPEEEYGKHSLTNHTLAQPGGIAVTPVIFHNVKTDETITIVHMGYRLCGFPFIVHGGMLATLLNETFKRNASLHHDTKSSSRPLKDDFKVQDLSITYRRPAWANQFFVVKTGKAQENGSQESVDNVSPTNYTSVIEAEDGTVLVKSSATLENTGRASNRLKSIQGKSRWTLF